MFFFLMTFALAVENKTQVTFQGLAYRQEAANVSSQSVELRIDNENVWRWSKRSTLKLRPLAIGDFVAKDSSETFFFDFKEAYYSRDTTRTTWTLGLYQVRDVGTDVLNPFDVIHPKRYKNPLDSEKLSLPGIKFESELARGLTWDIYYIPQNRKSLMPGQKNVWWPRGDRFPIKTTSSELRLPTNVEYEIGDEQVDNAALDHNIGTLIKATISSVDLYLLYYNGLNQTPDIAPVLNGTPISIDPFIIQLDNPITLRYRWKKAENVGLGLSLQLGSWLLRSFGRRQSINSNLEDWWVSELERTFHFSAFDLTWIFEISRGWNHRSDDRNDLQTINMIYYNADLLGLRFSFSETKVFQLGFIYDETFFGSLLTAKYTHAINDRYSLFLTSYHISGPDGTFYSLYRNNSSTAFGLVHYF